MKKLTTFAMVFTSAFVLAGCGGGGSGGSSDNTQKTPVNSSVPAVKPVEKPTVQQNKVENKGKAEKPLPIIEGDYVAGVGRGSVGFLPSSLWTNHQSIDVLRVSLGKDGYVSLIAPNRKMDKGWYKLDNGAVSSSELLDYVRYGAIEVETGRNVQIFAQGEKATDIPTQGVFNYLGQATWVEANKKDWKNQLQVLYGLPAAFIADFGNKKLAGAIRIPRSDEHLLFKASIKGEKFSYHNLAEEVDVSGAFYGKGASELGGVYILRDKASGSFGAKKQ